MISLVALNIGEAFMLDTDGHTLVHSTVPAELPDGWAADVANLEYAFSSDELLSTLTRAREASLATKETSLWMGFAFIGDGHLAGVLIQRVVCEDAEIDYLAVLPYVRRSGYGRQLLRLSEAIARHAHASRILLEVASRNTPALELYRSRGFRDIGLRKKYYRDGDDAVVLAMDLRSSR